MRRDLGEMSDMAAAERLVSVAGCALLDIGCGAGENARALAERGAEVLGVEPDRQAAAANRTAAPRPGLRFIEAAAEALPAESGTIDGVFFFRSLHHVPPAALDRALDEAMRVLKPATGFLYVVEPAVTGSFHELIRLFHDETAARAAAQAALERIRPRFAAIETCRYLQRPRFADFAALIARFAGSTYNSIRRESIDRPQVRARFAAGQAPDRTSAPDTTPPNTATYIFEQPLLVDLYRGIL